MFKDYTGQEYISNVKEQHNIMIFIGNGFDISVLAKYRNDKLISSYSKFYDYLCYKGFNENNCLFDKMGKDKIAEKENWSDFECSLGELIRSNVSIKLLDDALKEIQDMFLLFLNEIVTPEILLALSNDAAMYGWGKKALSGFLEDLCEKDYEKMSFPKKTGHYHMYNYLFVNFNYTSLFDNYVYLDRHQFEPHPYKTVDTNFKFYPNPNGYKKKGIVDSTKMNDKTVWSSFIMMNTIHPHGYQNIPKSLLLGIEDETYVSDRELNKFNKSYWAQNNQKYKSYFEGAELFIVYGTSIGETDSWWWRNICRALLTRDSELIIYYYNSGDYERAYIKQMFISASRNTFTEEEIMKIKEKIYVVLYNDKSDLKMFGLKNND